MNTVIKKTTKAFWFISLILGITTACSLLPSEEPPFEQAPIRVVWITLEQSQHDQLFEQFSKFADRHAFTIRISPTNPTGEDFLVQMWREDVEIVGVDSDPGLFKIGFYNANEESPTPVEVVDELIVDLKDLIEEIPNITFTVKE